MRVLKSILILNCTVLMFNLIYYSNDTAYENMLDYIYNTYPEHINNFTVVGETTYPRYDYRWKSDESKCTLKNVYPHDCDFKIEDNMSGTPTAVFIKLETIAHDGVIDKINVCEGCGKTEDIVFKKLVITCNKREVLMNIVDEVKIYAKEKVRLIERSTNLTVSVNYYKKDYWSTISRIPKRPIDTLFLKENQKEEMIAFVQEFCHEDTRDIYMKHGIPYKCVVLIYGPPGTGKTSTITSIASAIDSDIFIVPMFKELTDYTLVDALSGVKDLEDGEQSIIVLEDIDTIFDNRKEGDDNNMLTLNGLLNALDGHTCPEGSLIFLTANRPHVFDSALVRSCRIDYKVHLDYTDEYQVKNMFDSFFPEQKETFSKFYNMICGKQLTTAILQEFFFYNRKSKSIVSEITKLSEIIDKNDPGYYDKDKKDMYG